VDQFIICHPAEIPRYGGFLGLVILIILVAQKENQNRLNTQMTFEELD
jgi:hypothetical protein